MWTKIIMKIYKKCLKSNERIFFPIFMSSVSQHLFTLFPLLYHKIYLFLSLNSVFWVVLIFTQAAVVCLVLQYSPECSSQYFECQDGERWSNEVPGQDWAPRLSPWQMPLAADRISSRWLNISWKWFLAPFSK